MALFTQETPDNKFIVESSTEIGPTIGQELRNKAILAILFSMIGIVIYIWLRFELRFGIAARSRRSMTFLPSWEFSIFGQELSCSSSAPC